MKGLSHSFILYNISRNNIPSGVFVLVVVVVVTVVLAAVVSLLPDVVLIVTFVGVEVTAATLIGSCSTLTPSLVVTVGGSGGITSGGCPCDIWL